MNFFSKLFKTNKNPKKDNSFTEAHVQTELGRLTEKGEVLKLKKGIYKLPNY